MQKLNLKNIKVGGAVSMSGLQRIALILTIIGAVNWGLIGLFHFDLVASIFNGGNQLGGVSRIIYSIVGIAGLICISMLFRTEGVFVDEREHGTRTDM